jgi:hypothetical protein
MLAIFIVIGVLYAFIKIMNLVDVKKSKRGKAGEKDDTGGV